MEAVPENTQLPDFREYLEVEDVEEGYFEFVVLNTMANQFYLDWHALYNDAEIVCNSDEVNTIIADISDGSFGIALDLAGQVKALAMKNIEPVVQLTDDNATVEVILSPNGAAFTARSTRSAVPFHIRSLISNQKTLCRMIVGWRFSNPTGYDHSQRVAK